MEEDYRARLSYEVRTSVHSIIGYTELALEGTFGTLSPELAEASRRVLANSHHLLSVIVDLGPLVSP